MWDTRQWGEGRFCHDTALTSCDVGHQTVGRGEILSRHRPDQLRCGTPDSGERGDSVTTQTQHRPVAMWDTRQWGEGRFCHDTDTAPTSCDVGHQTVGRGEILSRHRHSADQLRCGTPDSGERGDSVTTQTQH